MRTPNGEVSSISPVTGLRTGTPRSVSLSCVGFGARQIDAKQRARKSVCAGRQLDRDEGAAGIARGGVDFYSELDRARRGCGARLDFVTIVHRAERQRLPPIDTIERSFHAVERRADARLSAAIVS